MAPPATARAKLEALGEDELIERLEQGVSMLEIARSLQVSVGSVHNYLHADPERSARVQLAQAAGAESFELEAVAVLDAAHGEMLEVEPMRASAVVSLAKERAQAAWRRASVRDPRRYSQDRASVTINQDNRRLQALTIVSVPTGVKGVGYTAPIAGGGGQNVGVLDSTAVLDSVSAIPTEKVPVLNSDAAEDRDTPTGDLFVDGVGK